MKVTWLGNFHSRWNKNSPLWQGYYSKAVCMGQSQSFNICEAEYCNHLTKPVTEMAEGNNIVLWENTCVAQSQMKSLAIQFKRHHDVLENHQARWFSSWTLCKANHMFIQEGNLGWIISLYNFRQVSFKIFYPYPRWNKLLKQSISCFLAFIFLPIKILPISFWYLWTTSWP